MRIDSVKTRYKEHVELNSSTPSTGDITCYDGIIIDQNNEKDNYESQSISISDCHTKVRLHRSHYDTDVDWLRKVRLLHEAIGRYRDHLEQKYEKDHP